MWGGYSGGGGTSVYTLVLDPTNIRGSLKENLPQCLVITQTSLCNFMVWVERACQAEKKARARAERQGRVQHLLFLSYNISYMKAEK